MIQQLHYYIYWIKIRLIIRSEKNYNLYFELFALDALSSYNSASKYLRRVSGIAINL